MTDLARVLDPIARRLLQPGESLEGASLATQQSFLSGWMVLVAVTERRLLLQRLSRRHEPEGEPISIRPGELQRAEIDGVSEGWWTPTSPIMDQAAIALRLRLRDGRKLKLRLMRGGDGLLGKLGGGEGQRRGVEALGRWLERAAQG